MQNQDETVMNRSRRKLLLWTPPVITAIALPAHAQASVCMTPPVAVGTVPAKCDGDATQIDSQGTIEIRSSSAEMSVDILNITSDAADPNVVTISATSGTVTEDSGIEITWEGPGADATTCLPETDVTITVEYTCNNDMDTFTVTFSLRETLGEVVP